MGIEQRLRRMGEWIEGVTPGRDARASTGDRASTAAARLLNRLAYTAYFVDLRIMAWLVLEGQALWQAHGPSPELVPVLSHTGAVAIGLNQDYRTAYAVPRHAVSVAEARGWEPATSEGRLLLANHSCHWREPLEQAVHHLDLARAGTLGHGMVQTACFTYRPATTAMVECAATMQVWAAEIQAGLAMALQMRNEYVVALMTLEGRLLRELQGVAEPEDVLAQEKAGCLERQGRQPAVSLSRHYCLALRAAVFRHSAQLAQHAAAAMAYVPMLANHRGAQSRLLHALSLAQQARAAGPAGRGSLCAELDAACEWFAARALDAPDNFLHLLHWIEAERAWATDDFRGAAGGFDTALHLLQSRTRPLHHALIAERCALFHLEQGMRTTGRQFMQQARRIYLEWGAVAKVRQLDGAHEFLNDDADGVLGAAGAGVGPRAVDTIDTLAILRASQALSSETSLVSLKRRVVDLMGALTGATGVRLVLWDEDARDWVLSEGEGNGREDVFSNAVAARGLLPLSALRYAERTRVPLLVEDAATDDRFGRDSYFSGLGHCSLLLVPILSKGALCAMLLLENRQGRGAFTTDRLDAVTLIAGQLAVSLENALIYDRLEQRVREQTRELVDAARRAGMSQIATNVLHNVGNVLNSVNVSARVLGGRIKDSRSTRVADVARLLQTHAADLAGFLTRDEQGRLMPAYLTELAQALAIEREEQMGELQRLLSSVDHIKNVVAMQLSYAGASGALEDCSITDLLDDALRMQEGPLARQGVQVVRDYGAAQPAALDKTRLMQIMVNLIENATQAMAQVDGDRRLKVTVRQKRDVIVVEVQDNGSGIASENMGKIFAHGFTTRAEGHGFGLHSCAIAAREMGGMLSAHSGGAGSGATFTLTLPAQHGPKA